MSNEKMTIQPGDERTLGEILSDLKKPVPGRFIASKTLKGNRIDYVAWYHLQNLLDYYTAGSWWYEITERQVLADRIIVQVRITIVGSDGTAYRDGQGSEMMDVDAYGSPITNAEAQAFRRACARFGLGLDLWIN